MSAPNPLWGIHVTRGAVCGAFVLRGDDGRHEVLDGFVETTADAPRDAVRRALARREVRGRPAWIAVGDESCAVGTGEIDRSELEMTDEEVVFTLHDFAPFEPGEGQLLYHRVGSGEERRYMVAAVPAATSAAFASVAAELDPARHGLGLASPALARGVRALGLVGRSGYAVDVQDDVTRVLAFDGDRVRRYLVAAGLRELARDGGAVALAHDLVRLADYHRELSRRGPGGPRPDFALVGAGASRARAALAAALGERLAPAAFRSEPTHALDGAGGGALDDARAVELVGAVGAALEALGAPTARLPLADVPADVPDPPAGPSPTVQALLVAAAVVAVGTAALGVWIALGRPGARG